jgi:anaphase-promoting complex subunit 1
MHLAIADAIGILFLGGCRYSLKNDLNSLAIMFIALMPKYPAHANDNDQHLQALRHLACLPAEKRAVIPVNTNKKIIHNTEMTIKFKGNF